MSYTEYESLWNITDENKFGIVKIEDKGNNLNRDIKYIVNKIGWKFYPLYRIEYLDLKNRALYNYKLNIYKCPQLIVTKTFMKYDKEDISTYREMFIDCCNFCAGHLYLDEASGYWEFWIRDFSYRRAPYFLSTRYNVCFNCYQNLLPHMYDNEHIRIAKHFKEHEMRDVYTDIKFEFTYFCFFLAFNILTGSPVVCISANDT